MERPVLVYDGDCGFCRLWIERWRQRLGDRVEFKASREAPESVVLREPGGRVSRGAEAVFRSLALAPWGGLWLRLYLALPPFRAASELAYRLVAANRPFFAGATRLLWGPAGPARAPVDGTVRALRAALGLCWAAAFLSLAPQVRGLIGPDGILPAESLLRSAAELDARRFLLVPSLAWLGASDAALLALCGAGAAAAAGLALGVLPRACALACWALYLSLCAVGGDFLSFQWDALILEAGLIAAFLPAPAALLLLRLLLAKLMLESGLVKLLSGDPSWRDLSALGWHYWTQPLPNALAWHVSQLPAALHKGSAALMFAVELGGGLLLLAPRRPRRWAAAAIAAFMAAIAFTGNYGFFNLLTAALCLAALDDSLPWLARLAPRRAARAAGRAAAPAAAGFAALWVLVSAVQLSLLCGLRPPFASGWSPLLAGLAPLRSINHYGLFAVMTKSRDEIEIELSADGRDWREQAFRWKPQDPRRAPRAPGPHMPRLDWQMWFLALGGPRDSPWFGNLLYRLLQGEPKVAALLGPPALGAAKPAYARAWAYSMRFTTREERRAGAGWWKKERKGLFYPVVSLGAQ